MVVWLYLIIPLFTTCVVVFTVGETPFTWEGIIPSLIVFSIFISGFFFLLTLKITVDSETISYHFTPFFKRKQNWDEIQSVEPVQVPFVGYGIRSGTGHGVVYTVGSKKGVKIITKEGKRLVLTSYTPDELLRAIEKYWGKV